MAMRVWIYIEVSIGFDIYYIRETNEMNSRNEQI